MRIHQQIDIETWNETPEQIQKFIRLWKIRSGYPHEPPLLTLGQCFELLSDITPNPHRDDSDGRFFNNIFITTEAIFGWDGKQPIDVLYLQIKHSIKQLFRIEATKRHINTP